MALAVWLDYNQAVIDGKIDQSSKKAQMWMRVLLCVLAIAFGVSIGWSRFVLGAHSMNQIILGLLLGAWIALTIHFGAYHTFMN
jgi:membrane-associated phospholipid phosphatase